MPEYVKIAGDCIHLAEKGALSIRPINRKVYDPGAPNPNESEECQKLGRIIIFSKALRKAEHETL